MSNTKWTKGPWRFGRTDESEVMVLGVNGDYVCNIQIHQTPRELGLWQEPERKANAQLIVTLPKLYDAFSEIVEWARDIAGDCENAEQREKEYLMMERMDSLLAKARGES